MSSNLYAYAFNNPINCDDEDGTWPKWVKNAVKIAIGVAAVAVGVALTGGVAAIPVAVKTVATIAVTSAAVSATVSTAKSIIKKENVKTTAKKAASAAVDGFSNGVMAGGITAGISTAISTLPKPKKMKIGHTDKPKYGIVTLNYGDGDSFTAMNIANSEGKSRFRIDLSQNESLHLHYGKTSKAREKHRTTAANIIFGIIEGIFSGL